MIAHKRHRFIRALFPQNYPAKHFHIADVSPEGQVSIKEIAFYLFSIKLATTLMRCFCFGHNADLCLRRT